MKIYRVVPDSFATGARLNANEEVSSEDIYYKMGYIPCEEKKGKYFYLFAEDAIQKGYYLITCYHHLIADTISIIEYDVPEDIIMKNIGHSNANYTYDLMPSFLVETFIEKCDLGSRIITSDQVEENEKLRNLILVFKDSLKRMQEYGFYACGDNGFYKDYFGVNSLSSINDEEKIKNTLVNSKFYQTFLNQQRELILSTFITGKTLPVNMGFVEYKLGGWDEYGKYYQNIGIRCDFSNEHQEFKEELLYNIKNSNPDKEKIRKLLKEEKYM